MGFFSKRNPPVPPARIDPLDTPLWSFSEADPFTIREACEGIQIFGGIGSGKTSGSGAFFAQAMLAQGFGGIVLTAKADEIDLWKTYAAKTGRSDDLLIVGEGGTDRCNVFEYECQKASNLGILTESLVELIMTLTALSSVQTGGGNSLSGFWENEQRKLLRNSIDLLRCAGLPVSLTSIYRVITSAPRSLEEADKAEWKNESFCYRAIDLVQRKSAMRDAAMKQAKAEATAAKVKAQEVEDCPYPESDDDEFEQQQKKPSDSRLEWFNDQPSTLEDWQLVLHYWSSEFPGQAEKTRANFVGMVTGVLDYFIRGTLRDLFSTETTFVPEDTFKGKIIILNLPQKRFHHVGVYAQVFFKYCWQRAVERRVVHTDSRPVFQWIDESQYFLNKHDVSFQTTSRSLRVCSVYLTQNLPNYFVALGGKANAEPLVHSLLGNLVTKVFHNNTCAETNKYASELFAQEWKAKYSQSISQGEQKDRRSDSQDTHLKANVLPREFSGLLTGGPQNEFCVEGIIHKGGHVFALSGLNALKVAFEQNH